MLQFAARRTIEIAVPFALEPTALQILCDALGDGVLLVDENSNIDFVNEAASRLLEVGEAQLLGQGCEEIMKAQLGLSASAIARLRSGELVPALGPDGPATLRLQRVVLPPSGAWPSSRSREVPSAIIIRDVRAGVALRKTEKALSRLHAHESGVASASATALQGHDTIIRGLQREVARCHRSGDVLSVLLLQAPAEMEPRRLGRLMIRVLDERWNVGVLDVDEEVDLRAVRPVNLAVPLDPDFNWLLVVMPGSPTTEAHATVLRMRNHLSAFVDPTSVAVGVATLEPGRAWIGGDDPVEGTQTLLERAFLACLAERPPSDEERRFADTLITSVHSA